MANKVYQRQKCVLNYSKSRVDRAGRDIRHGCDGAGRDEAIAIIQNFRETHLYPLMLLKNHIVQAAKKVSKKAIVARRLKRLPTIINKLERPTLDGKRTNAIKLTRMQDIGGCRAILPNLKQLNDLHNRLKKSRSVHQIIRTDDYLIPKESGYSGVHLIYSCFLGADEVNEWTKTKIEVQLRTELQHAWATSLEIIDVLEDVELKTSMKGHEKWRRFFQLSGSLVAHEEGAHLIGDDDVSDMVKELKALEDELDIKRKLFEYRFAIKVITDKANNFPKRLMVHQGLFLVSLKKLGSDNDKASFELTLSAFGPSETEESFSRLAKDEADSEVMLTVLVSASDVRTLKKAYPNYFGSSMRFHNFLDKYIDMYT